MLNSPRRLGVAGALLNALEPGGGLQPSQVTTGNSRPRGSRAINITDEDACPEEVLTKPTNNKQAVVFTPELLGGLAETDEISDVLERLSSYIAIVPDLGTSFAYIDFLEGFELATTVREKALEEFKRHWQICQDLLFAKNASLQIGIHKFIQQWLTYGKIYFAIIREQQFGKIIDIHSQLTDFKSFKDKAGNEYWQTDFNQYVWEKEDIFVLDWADIAMQQVSYVASIMRTYNMWITVERTRVANAVMSAQFRSIYTVPTAGLGKVKARQKLSSVMGLYKREIRINPQSGETTINGENSYPVNTELWVAETTGGAVKIENPGDGNPQLNNTDLVDYFARKYYKHGKLPMSKYEAVDQGYLNGLSEIDEDERQFKLFIQKCRSVIAQLFLNIVWRMISVLPDYAGRDEYRKHACMNWYDEPKHETPEEQLDGTADRLDKIESLLDKYADTLKKSGFTERSITARLNVLRVKLMHKYCPDLLEQTQEDYRNVPEEESTDSQYDTENSDWDSTDMESGTDDFSDWDDSDWDDEFSADENNGDDWSMPEETSDDFSDFDW